MPRFHAALGMASPAKSNEVEPSSSSPAHHLGAEVRIIPPEVIVARKTLFYMVTGGLQAIAGGYLQIAVHPTG